MKSIKRLFLLIALVLTIFCFGSAMADNIVPVDFGGTISAVKNYENDFLNVKDNELVFSTVTQSTSSISKRRNETNNSACESDGYPSTTSFSNDNLIIFKDIWILSFFIK